VPLPLVFFFFSLLFIMDGTPLFAAEERAKSKPALPGEQCVIAPQENWTIQEKWVWRQVCEGRIADFNETKDYGGKLDPGKPKEWPKERMLRPAFLETIIFHEPYRSAVPREGVFIVGAWFKETLHLSNVSISRALVLAGSLFESDVTFIRFKTTQALSLAGSKFSGKLDMSGLQVGEHLFMTAGAKTAEVKLLNDALSSVDDVEMWVWQHTQSLDCSARFSAVHGIPELIKAGEGQS